MKNKTIILLLVIMLFGSIAKANADSFEKKQFRSPNGKFIAYVIPSPRAPYGWGESKIVIETKKGKVLCSKDYSSEDGEHGFGVVQAAWTPDSRFFVYSMSDSGGHQPWHWPVDFISTTDFKVRSLDDYVGSIVEPGFEVKKPAIVKAVKQSDTLQEQPLRSV